jgi:hypothetical protein
MSKKRVQKEGPISKDSLTHYLAMWGCICTGIVYTGIGVIALLSFFNLKQGGADESSMLAYLDQFIAGKILIWLVLTGMVSYIVWRVYETIYDPYGYGKDLKGRLKRAGIGLSSLADALIAFSALKVLFGTGAATVNGQPRSERKLAARILNESWGDWALAVAGGIVIGVAIMQMVYAITFAYQQRLDITRLDAWKRKSINVLAWIGHFARGIILSIIGFFMMKAAFEENAQLVVNTDKAFDFIGDDVGHVWFIIVALATICYGFFMFLMGIYYDSDKG